MSWTFPGVLKERQQFNYNFFISFDKKLNLGCCPLWNILSRFENLSEDKITSTKHSNALPSKNKNLNSFLHISKFVSLFLSFGLDLQDYTKWSFKDQPLLNKKVLVQQMKQLFGYFKLNLPFIHNFKKIELFGKIDGVSMLNH